MNHFPIQPGFVDPVFDAQAVFRGVLKAMSRPGTGFALPVSPRIPLPLFSTTGAILLALADLDTPVWLDPALETPEIQQYLRFHCGCPLTGQPEKAVFAVIGRDAAHWSFTDFYPGHPAYPDRSATLIFQVENFDAAEGKWLAGPGIDGRIRMAATGLKPDFWDQFKTNGEQFPLGLDVILASPEAVRCLPRTVKVED